MGYPENWEKDCPWWPPLPEDHIPKQLRIGEKYHVSWARDRAMVWILESIGEFNCILRTKRGKILTVKTKDLREINRNVIHNAKVRYYATHK